jgi:tRNA modification GTPase
MISAGETRSTIVAIASSMAPALRGIVRIAGEDAVEVLTAMAPRMRLPQAVRPLRLTVALELEPPLGTVDAVALVWPGTRSYTGSPSVEIHTHGAAPLLEAIVSAAVRAGARPAGPGEFTMRAFLAGRLDLPQAEAVLGVIDATSRDQLDAALSQLAGNVSQPLGRVRDDLLNLLADLEAGLDFVEEDIQFIDDASLAAGLRSAADVIEVTAKQMAARHRSAAMSDLVLLGAPNAGKSSLLNALVGHDAAIVSSTAGTTRDVLWRETSILGHPVRLIDTAGLEDERDAITQQSQRAARESQKTAALTLYCVDQRLIGDRTGVFHGVAPCGTTVLNIATQGDRAAPAALERLRKVGWMVTSAVSGLGLDELRQQIASELDLQISATELGAAATAARCGDSIRRAGEAVSGAIELLRGNAGHEWVASEIRLALSAVGEITGEIYTDDILDRVFSRFCIGK